MAVDLKVAFGDTDVFAQRGGLAQMGEALESEMVLVMSLWDDHEAKMLWLDSDYPLDKDASQPGVSRGPCATTSGDPTTVESQSPDATVVFSNIKWGDIGSTFSNTGAVSPPPPPPSGGSTTAPAGS